MNKGMLRKSVGAIVRLRPIPRRFDGGTEGRELPRLDRPWRITYRQKEGIFLNHIGTPHGFLLRFDQIRNFVGDTIQGEGHGFLVLTSQVNLGGDHVWLDPLDALMPAAEYGG